MSSIVGKLTAAVAAVQNENQLSLANLNFDFTLVRYEAPKEFSGVGAIISPQRRANAEEGAMHRTARKLGALFEGRLPPTSALFKAYGTRVSEISKDSASGHVVPEKIGIFGRQLGADCSSIWAAVTSGSEAIAVHLLACMLARTFTGPEATSVWVELVEKQKLLIAREAEDSMYAQKLSSSVLAAQQDISRTDLGNWDSSARAWLQIADQVKERQQKQLMLIVNNTSLPIRSSSIVFDSVMSAWKTALAAMDNLVKGIPQQVQDGAALLAISSWHLYPDLLVVGNKVVNVHQSDPVFGGTAILTLGLQAVRDSDKGVSWSLPLACLRFYGHPVMSTGTIGIENSRISMQQFGYVVLGCVVSSWNDYGICVDDAAEWLQQILALIKQPPGRSNSSRGFHLHWLRYLQQAAQSFVECEGVDRQLANQLVALGHRNSGFIYHKDCEIPIFGLSKIEDLIPLLATTEDRIELLRQLASKMRIRDDDYIIRYLSPSNNQNRGDRHHNGLFEFCTLIPKTGRKKRAFDGRVKATRPQAGVHTRWLPIDRHHFVPCHHKLDKDRGSNLDGNLECSNCTQAKNQISCQVVSCTVQCAELEHTELWLRHEEIKKSGENCFLAAYERTRVRSFEDSDSETETDFTDDEEPLEAFRIKLTQGNEANLQTSYSKLRDEMLDSWHSDTSARFAFVAGDPSRAAIFRICGASQSSWGEIDPVHMKSLLVPEKIDTEALSRFLENAPERTPLKCCASATDVYKLMPDATISTKFLSHHILSVKWTLRVSEPESQEKGKDHCTLNRREAFACVAMFDTGTCNLDPAALTQIFAMSSGNSIFVAGSLLCDPYERTEPNEIRRVVGNIGRAGISLLMNTPKPEIRERELENWKQINHHPFRGNLENCFGETTVHLSFSGYDMPLATQENDRYIDRPANLVETLVSVYERGKWVADLDIILSTPLPEAPMLSYVRRVHCVGHQSALQYNDCQKRPRFTVEEVVKKYNLPKTISADNWDEVLEPPRNGILVARAHDNWLARYALTCVCMQLGFKTLLLPREPCWSCCAHALDGTTSWKQVAMIL
ncbi:hypothetical protein BKA65DRAFT_68138 [Rhexocercosporidium sp. MPI-PUGE-AT-0058]|nr:hypothetical protein BKA65DRAFT_68138 [Rhexocercosporidium sp. MPI-PUGE-AT-0058]